ncbi:hypothetical protein EDC04DRAFT_2597600 [Pisolithus marmoratus]|nr:hypothetical protein EDC04DRAFT_2597600 [Pisolithus marmoratus]
MSTTVEEELQVLYDNLRQIRYVNYVTKCRRILVQALFIFGRYYALVYLVGWFAGTVSMIPRIVILTFNGMTVNNHQGFSIHLYAVISPSFADTNHFSAESCKAYYFYFTFGGELLYSTLVNIILVIRLNAMYQIFFGTKGLRKHQIFLASVLIIEFSVEVGVCVAIATWLENRVTEPPAGVPWPGCTFSDNPNTALTLTVPAWIIAILAATIFLGLTLRLLYSSMKSRFERFRDFTIPNIKGEIRNIQPVTLTLVRDSVLFYFPMFGKPANTTTKELTACLLNLGILVASLPVTVTFHTDVANVTIPILVSLYSFCLLDDDQASRLIIHIRESLSRSSDNGSSREVEPINFASRSLMASHAGTQA